MPMQSVDAPPGLGDLVVDVKYQDENGHPQVRQVVVDAEKATAEFISTLQPSFHVVACPDADHSDCSQLYGCQHGGEKVLPGCAHDHWVPACLVEEHKVKCAANDLVGASSYQDENGCRQLRQEVVDAVKATADFTSVEPQRRRPSPDEVQRATVEVAEAQRRFGGAGSHVSGQVSATVSASRVAVRSSRSRETRPAPARRTATAPSSTGSQGPPGSPSSGSDEGGDSEEEGEPPQLDQVGGLQWYPASRLWSATIVIAGEQLHLGRFRFGIDAVDAWKRKAVEVWGPRAGCLLPCPPRLARHPRLEWVGTPSAVYEFVDLVDDVTGDPYEDSGVWDEAYRRLEGARR